MASVGRDGARTDWTDEAPYLARFGEHLEDGKWGMFDLRELRRHFAAERNREAAPAIAELVFRYDALALAPLFHAAEPCTATTCRSDANPGSVRHQGGVV